MKYVIAMVMRLLTVWILGSILVTASNCFAQEIEGYWLADNPSGNSLLFCFGPEDAFYKEDGSYWIQGTYRIIAGTIPKRLDLYIANGSDIEDVGKVVRYQYKIDDNLIVLSEFEPLSPLDASSSSVRPIFIGYNLNSSDDDDDEDGEFTFYASCFLGEL